MTARLTDAQLWDIRSQQGEAGLGPRPVERVRRKRTYEESDTQIHVFKWWKVACREFKVKECLMFAVPNGSALGTGREEWQIRQRVIRGKRAKAEGARPGVLDVVLLVPNAHHPALLWETKTKKGIVSPEQIEFIEAIRERGYAHAVCRSAAEAISTITGYLNNE